jgi:3-oxoacyl-[acyl-carrier-protein] synthase III
LLAAGILGTGSYLPEEVITNKDLEQIVETSDAWIRERTGIRERRRAAEQEATSDLCLQAARRALADAGIEGSELDLIIVATVTPDMAFPATGCLVQDRLGAARAFFTVWPWAASSSPLVIAATYCSSERKLLVASSIGPIEIPAYCSATERGR